MQADELPDAVFTAIGRTVWQDIGPTAVSMRLVMKVCTGLWYSRMRLHSGVGFVA